MLQNWPSYMGDYVIGNESSRVAILIVGRGTVDVPAELFRIKGTVKTENLGLEKVILNIISNPSIRFLVVCGKEEYGHFPGDAVVSVAHFGVDADMRIVSSISAIPYLSSITTEAVERFRSQVEVVDLVHPKKVEEMLALDPIYEFEPERRKELMKVLKELKGREIDDFPAEPMELEVRGLRQSGEVTGRKMHRTADIFIESMLRMPSETLSTRVGLVIVDQEFGLGLDPISGVVFESPDIKLAERMKAYFTGE